MLLETDVAGWDLGERYLMKLGRYGGWFVGCIEPSTDILRTLDVPGTSRL